MAAPAPAEVFTMGCHVGTHIDALGHVSQDDCLYGGARASDVQRGGRLSQLGAEEIPPTVCRGILLDVAGALGVEVCDPAYEITPQDLEAAAAQAGVEVPPGGAVLVRTGWGRHFEDPVAYLGLETGVPGVGSAAAELIARRGARMAGTDTIAFDRIRPGVGHALLPAHRTLLVDHGVHIIEILALDGLAAAGVHEFTFILAPLKMIGATGSPVRPLAAVGAA